MVEFFPFALLAAFSICLYIKGKLFTKRLESSPLITATLVELKKEVTENSQYYKGTYEFADEDDAIKRYEKIEERKRTVGKQYKMFYLKKKNGQFTLVDKHILKENKEGPAWLLLAFAGLMIVIGSGFLIASLSEDIGLTLGRLGGTVIGFLIMMIGILQLLNYFGIIRLKKDEFTREMQATVINFTKRADSESHGYTYFPIYEYEINGTIKEYESPLGSRSHAKINSKATLYYNLKTGEVFEPHAAKSALLGGVIATPLGGVAFVIMIMDWMGCFR